MSHAGGQTKMRAVDARRGRVAAMSAAVALGLAVDDALVLSSSNRMVVRLMPCNVVARVAPIGYRVFSAAEGEREIEIVRRLTETDCPAAGLEPRVAPRVYIRDGFEIGMWTYYEPVESGHLSPSAYAHALERLHQTMRQVDVRTPHFADRLADVQRWVAHRDDTPLLPDEDGDLLVHILASLRRSIVERGAAEQLLHGEPHPWNVLDTKQGPLFIDFENCVRGPVEFDLAWLPKEASERYAGADQDLVGECRGVVLAIIAAHRWRRDDRHPEGRQSGIAFLDVVREGPPWPSLDSV